MQDSNDMHKVFLAIALGEDGPGKNSPIRKLDFQIVQRLLGGH